MLVGPAGAGGSRPVVRARARRRSSRRGSTPPSCAQTADLTRIMVLSPVLLAAGAIATSVLNSRERFGAAALAPLVYNLAMIFGAIALVPAFGVQGLAYGVVLGALGHILVQVPSLVGIGARIRPFVDLGDDAGANRAAADGAESDRSRRDADRVRGHDEPRLDARGRGDLDVQLRVRDAPDPDRGDRRAARHRPAALAVPRGRPRGGGGVHAARHAGPVAARLRHGGDRGARDRGLGGSRPPAVRGDGHAGGRPRRRRRRHSRCSCSASPRIR